MINEQVNMFDVLYPKYKITKPIRLIEFFAGYGSQALALKYLDMPFEHWKICEWAIKSIQAYKDIHFNDDSKDYSIGLTLEDLQDILYRYGISSNYNEPMTKKQIDLITEKKLRTIFNNICSTHNLVNIQNVNGKDLCIKDIDKFTYLLTYSFPCQDLSLAGKGKGMSDTSTRSGMLWEVERILTECHELGNMPQILLMENVPQVHSEDNVEDFNKWKDRLEELGYKNYFQDLIATDYGIPQTRNRCFMISLLGDYSYTFPKPIPLKLKLKDMLEDNVDEKYYLSNKMLEYITSKDDKYKVNDNKLVINRNIACSKTTREGNTRADTTDYICKDLPENYNIKNINDGNKTFTTLGTNCGSSTSTGGGVVVIKSLYSEAEKKLFTDDGNIRRYIDSNIIDKFEEGQMATTSFPNGYGHGPRTHNESVSLTTIEKPSVKQNLRIRKLTPKECGRLMGVKDEDIDKITLSDSAKYHIFGDSIVVNVLMAIFNELLKKEGE